MRWGWPVFLLASAAWGQPDGAPDKGGADKGGGHGAGLFISPMGEPFRGPDAMDRWFRGVDLNGDGRLSPAECAADAARFFPTLDVNGDGEIDPEELARYETEVAPEVGSGGGDFGDGGRGGGRHGGGRGGGGHHGGGGGGGGGGGRGMGGGAGNPGDGPDGSTRAAMPERPQGAARFGLLALPEPVIAADADFNRGVSRVEFRNAALARCHLLDRDGDGLVARTELPARPGAGPGRR